MQRRQMTWWDPRRGRHGCGPRFPTCRPGVSPPLHATFLPPACLGRWRTHKDRGEQNSAACSALEGMLRAQILWAFKRLKGERSFVLNEILHTRNTKEPHVAPGPRSSFTAPFH